MINTINLKDRLDLILKECDLSITEISEASYYTKRKIDRLFKMLDVNTFILPDIQNYYGILSDILFLFGLSINDLIQPQTIFSKLINKINHCSYISKCNTFMAKTIAIRFISIYEKIQKITSEISRETNLSELEILDLVNNANFQIKQNEYNIEEIHKIDLLTKILNPFGWYYYDLLITHDNFNKKFQEFIDNKLSPVISINETISENRAKRIKTFREAIGITIEESAKKIEIELGELRALENEAAPSTFQIMFKIFEFYEQDYPKLTSVILEYNDKDFERFINNLKTKKNIK